MLLCHDKEFLQREGEFHQSAHLPRTFSKGLNVCFVTVSEGQMKPRVLRPTLSTLNSSNLSFCTTFNQYKLTGFH